MSRYVLTNSEACCYDVTSENHVSGDKAIVLSVISLVIGWLTDGRTEFS